MAAFKIAVNGQESEIMVERRGEHLLISRAGKSSSVRIVHDDGTAIVLEREMPDGSLQHIRAARYVHGDGRQIWVEGRTFSYQRVRHSKSTTTADYVNNLSASIPAIVSQLLVQVGDSVSVGQKLILLESMKMIIPIQAPCEGTISAVNCAVGDAVQPGVQLVEIEETEG